MESDEKLTRFVSADDFDSLAAPIMGSKPIGSLAEWNIPASFISV